ncbi:hypothetical protein GLYMA_02G282800v4 [Glycine max]|uniref:Membrin n=1 Tax=Glycine max TaxID=3847 RepID=A0A0R0L2Z2_SOYBN|nr:hypothetical protein GYH30_005487 [Glycine max]KRH73594.1 hypothetical protein GLYMA_02G282800v4 [Glycine max]
MQRGGATLSEVYQSAKKRHATTSSAWNVLLRSLVGREKRHHSDPIPLRLRRCQIPTRSLEEVNNQHYQIHYSKFRMMEAKERAELLGRAELENANALGEAILSTIHGQRDRLKSAHRKALDVLNTVGISNSVLRLIERRNRGDQWIKYAGKLLTIIFLIAFVLWRH